MKGECGKETAREAELALVLAAVEQERHKGGGILKRKNPESISSVSQLLWPLYLIQQPDVDRYTTFDGLGLFEHVLDCRNLPQLDSFEKHLVRSTASNVTGITQAWPRQ